MAAIACLVLVVAGMAMAVGLEPQQESRCLLNTGSVQDETSLLQVGTFPLVYNAAPKAAANAAIYRAKQAEDRAALVNQVEKNRAWANHAAAKQAAWNGAWANKADATRDLYDDAALARAGVDHAIMYNEAANGKAAGNALWEEANGVKNADQWASYENSKKVRNHAWLAEAAVHSDGDWNALGASDYTGTNDAIAAAAIHSAAWLSLQQKDGAKASHHSVEHAAGSFSLLQINSSEAATSMTGQLPMQATPPQQAGPGMVQFSVQAAQQQAGVAGAAVSQQPAGMAMPQQPAMGQQPTVMAMPQQQAMGMPQASPQQAPATGMPMQQQPGVQAAAPQPQNGMATFEGMMQAEGLLAPQDAKYPQAGAAPQQGGLPQPIPGFPAAAAPQQPANMAASPAQLANMATAPPGAPPAAAPATAQAPDAATLALKVFDEFKKGKYTGSQCRQNVAALFTEDAVVDFRGPQDMDFFKLYSPGHDGVCDYFAQCSHYAANDMKANLFAKGDRIVLVWDYVPGFIGPDAKKASGRISQYNIMSFNPEKTRVNRFEALFDKPSLYDELKFDGKKPPVKTPQMAIVAKVFASFAQGHFYGENCKKSAGALFANDAVIDMTGEGDAKFFKKYPAGVAGVCEYYQGCYDYVMNNLNASMYARGDDVIMVLHYVPGMAPKESLLQEKSILLQETSLLQRQAPAIPQDPALEFYVVNFNADKSKTRGFDVFHLPFGGAPDAGQGQAGAESLVSLGSTASQPIGAPAAPPAVAASGATAAGAAAAPAAAEMTQLSQQMIQLPYASFADSNYGSSGNDASQKTGASPSPTNSAPQSLPAGQGAPTANMMPPLQTASMMAPQQMTSMMPQQQMMSQQVSNMMPQQLMASMMPQQQVGMVPQAPGMVPQAAGMAPQSSGVVPQLPGMMPQAPASYAGYGASVATSQLTGTGGFLAGPPAPQLSMPQQPQTQNALDAAFSAGMRTGLQSFSASQSPVQPIQPSVQPKSSLVQPPQSLSWPEQSAVQPPGTYTSSLRSGPPNLGNRMQTIQAPLQPVQSLVQPNTLSVAGQMGDPDVPRPMQPRDLPSQREMEGPAAQPVEMDGGAAQRIDEQMAMIAENREGRGAEDVARAFDIGASVQGEAPEQTKLSQEHEASAKGESDEEKDQRLAKAAWRATASMQAVQVKLAEEEREVLAAQARNQAAWESKVKETFHGKAKATTVDLDAEGVTKALSDGDVLAAASAATSAWEAAEVVKAYKAQQVAKAQKATAQAVQADKVAKLFNAVTAGNTAKSPEVAAEAERAAKAIKADSIANAREAVKAFGKADKVAKALAVVAVKARAGPLVALAVNSSVNHTISSTSGVNHSADSSVNQSISSTSGVNHSADSEGMYKLDTFNCGLFGGTQLWSAWQGGNSAMLLSEATSATKTLQSAFSHNMNEGCITLPNALSTSSSQINMVALAGCSISFFSFPLCRGDEYRVLVARRRAAWVKSDNVASLGLDPFGTIESVQCSCR